MVQITANVPAIRQQATFKMLLNVGYEI